MFKNDPPLTKRQLGWLLVGGGVLAAVAVLSVDLVGAGQFSGLGPRQWQALGGCALIVAFGLSLVPLGDKLA